MAGIFQKKQLAGINPSSIKAGSESFGLGCFVFEALVFRGQFRASSAPRGCVGHGRTQQCTPGIPCSDPDPKQASNI